MNTHVISNPLTPEDEAAWLNAPDRPISFTDRCTTARQTIYAEQRRRNERFEHLRRLLCKKPEAAAAPKPLNLREEIERSRADAERRELLAESRAAKCTCRCRIEHHRPWVYLGTEGGRKLWKAGAIDEPQCEDCLADRTHECQADLHWRTLPKPDSRTVTPHSSETNAELHREMLHEEWGCCEPTEAREDAEATSPEQHRKDAATKITGIRDLDDRRERRGAKHALVAVNGKSRYVTVQYGAKQACRVSMNTTTGVLTVSWVEDGEAKTWRSKRYQTLDGLEAAREQATEKLLELGHAETLADIQQARSTQYRTDDQMWEKVRRIQSILAARGTEARVWDTSTRKAVAA